MSDEQWTPDPRIAAFGRWFNRLGRHNLFNGLVAVAILVGIWIYAVVR